MTPFLIGTAELDALVAGQPSIVAAPGMAGLDSMPLTVLQPRDGVLRRTDMPDGAALPLPPDLRPLAILAPDAEAASSLAAGLPPGVAVLVGANPVPALLAHLAAALAASETVRREESSRDATPQPIPIPSSVPSPAPSQASSVPATSPDLATEMAPTGADFQDLKIYQHSVSADGGYRHIDLGLIGLASASGIWREVRLKVFDRRGILGIEFRNIKGWPRLFDTWPDGGSDRFGLFWRLESQGIPAAMAMLGSAHNRAVVAALLEVLPTAAHRAAALAGLPDQDQEAWAARGNALVAAVALALGSAAATAARS